MIRTLISLMAFHCFYAIFEENSPVLRLNHENFDRYVMGIDRPWLIIFYAPSYGPCNTVAPVLEQVARELGQLVSVGAVDMTVEEELTKSFHIDGFLTILLFGSDKGNPLEYEGEKTYSEIRIFVLKQIKSEEQIGNSDVIVLTDENYREMVVDSSEMWMLNLYAPWCGHCQDLEPEWASAASILKGQVKFGKLDATVEAQTANKFAIKTYPMTIALSPYDKETIVAYDGPLDADSIVNFGLSQLEEFGVLVEIRQAISNDVVVDCKAIKACVMGFLPHILDASASERNEHIRILQKVAGKYRRQPVTFYWAQAGDFLGFENSLGLGFGYPALVLLSLEKERYTVMRNAFREVDIDIFVAKALRGQISFNQIRKFPVLEEVEVWDGLSQATNSKGEDL